MSGYETIVYEKKGWLAFITLNRPHVLNIYNLHMRDELYEVLGAVKEDPEIRVLILKGAGEKAFCVVAGFERVPISAFAHRRAAFPLVEGCMGQVPELAATCHCSAARLCARVWN